MKLPDKTYFKNLIAIPDIEEQWFNLSELAKDSSEKIIIETLGQSLFNELRENPPTDAESTLYKFWYGSDYEVDGITYNWKGFINGRKLSLLAYAIWYDWACESWLLNTGAGSAVKTPDFWEKRNQKQRMSKVHNMMEQEIMSMYDFIFYHIEDFDAYGFKVSNNRLKIPYEFKNTTAWGF